MVIVVSDLLLNLKLMWWCLFSGAAVAHLCDPYLISTDNKLEFYSLSYQQPLSYPTSYYGICRLCRMLQHWHGYLSGARCKWFACGPADVTATPLSLAPVESRMVYLSGAGLPRLSWKKVIKWMLLLLLLLNKPIMTLKCSNKITVNVKITNKNTTATVITRTHNTYLLYPTIFLFSLTTMWINKYCLLIDHTFYNWSRTVRLIYALILAGVRQLCLLAKLSSRSSTL